MLKLPERNFSFAGATPIELVLAGAAPDHLNRNTALRSYVAEGFKEVLGVGRVASVPLEHAEESTRRFRPRLTLVFGSCLPDQCDYYRLRHACDTVGCPLAFWLHDDPYEFDASARVRRLADHIFTNDRWAMEHYHRERVWHLPLAASPRAHRPAHKLFHDRMARDVFFCGVSYPSRQRILRDLASVLAKVETEIYGDGWDTSLLPFCRNERIANSSLADYYATSRIVLNMGRDFHYANRKYQLDPSTPGPRTFEAAMAGACQLMFAESLEILDYFELGEEILLFDSPADFRRTLDRMLADPRHFRQIGAAAQARCLRDHTYAMRQAIAESSRLIDIRVGERSSESPGRGLNGNRAFGSIPTTLSIQIEREVLVSMDPGRTEIRSKRTLRRLNTIRSLKFVSQESK